VDLRRPLLTLRLRRPLFRGTRLLLALWLHLMRLSRSLGLRRYGGAIHVSLSCCGTAIGVGLAFETLIGVRCRIMLRWRRVAWTRYVVGPGGIAGWRNCRLAVARRTRVVPCVIRGAVGRLGSSGRVVRGYDSAAGE
jgi:hypothetical protein